MGNRAYRHTRTGVLGLVVLAISLAGHAADSQLLPTAFGFLLALVLTLALSVVASMRARSLTWLLGFVLGLQLLLHFVLVIVSGGSHAATGHGSLLPSASGVIGHVIAGLVAAMVLKFGDGLLDRWSYLLSRVFGDVAVAVVPIAAPVRVLGALRHIVMSSIVLDFAPRRGPPALSS